jgi:hypothetical protein
MSRRILLKALIVVGLGVALLADARPALAHRGDFCYTCWPAEFCPDYVLANAICADIGGELCPEFNTCTEMDPACPTPQPPWPGPVQVFITCRARTGG